MTRLHKLRAWATKKDWQGAPKWKRVRNDVIFYSFICAFLYGAILGPLIEDFDRLNARQECEAKHHTVCQNRWVPVEQ